MLTGPSSGEGGADCPSPPPIAGRLPTIMLPYSSPPSDTMLDMSGTLVVGRIAPLPPVAVEAPLVLSVPEMNTK